MTDAELKEYEVLSEDRRRAISIFLKGVLITIGIMAFGFKLLMDTKSVGSLLVIFLAGLLISFCGIPYWIRCKRHDLAIFTRLTEITSHHGLTSVISTQYIFNVALILGFIIVCAWVAMFIVRIMEIV